MGRRGLAISSATTFAIQWVRDHRDEILSEKLASAQVDNLNVPTCAAGAIRGLAQVIADINGSGTDALTPADCTSTAPEPSTDVAAFLVGFATLTVVPTEPAG